MQKKFDDNQHYKRIEAAIEFLAKNRLKNPSLFEVAQSVGMSEFHFQRTFRRWTGVSPKNLLQYLTLEGAKEKLSQNQDILNTSLDLGLSGPSRLHDLFVKLEAMSPGEYKKKGKGLKIEYGFATTPFGLALIGITKRGLCHLHFVSLSKRMSLKELEQRFPFAELVENRRSIESLSKQLFKKDKPSKLLAIGSSFQIKVWEALLRIPEGSSVSYQEVASMIGQPRAARAVGSAIACNQIAILIPCHRVIKSNGIVGDYRWGSTKKQALLCFESARKDEKI